MEDKNTLRCPKCGYSNVYVGAITIECGYVTKCENYTKQQALEVQKIIAQKFPSTSQIEDIDWTDEEETTNPYGFSISTPED